MPSQNDAELKATLPTIRKMPSEMKEDRPLAEGLWRNFDFESLADSKCKDCHPGLDGRWKLNDDQREKAKIGSSLRQRMTEEEQRAIEERKRAKKWLTACLAAVATVHAATKVYHSFEKRDKRPEEFRKGEISSEKMRKKQNAARCQDAVEVGITPLGRKGAMSEYDEVQDQQQEHQEPDEHQREMPTRRREREHRRAKEQAWKNRQHGGGSSRLITTTAMTEEDSPPW